MCEEKSFELTPNQRKAIAALLKYPTFREAAHSIGVNEKTIERWMSEPAFRIELYQRQTAVLDQVMMPLTLLAGKAIISLADVMTNPHQRGASQKRLAARDVLDILTRMRDRVLDERLTTLEDQVYGQR